LFRPYLKDFYVNSTDASYVRGLKLDILASLATETSIQSILSEFQAYVKDADKEFASQAIAAMGRCAHKLPAIAERYDLPCVLAYSMVLS
jgi:AP-3 complex subunit beta